MKKTTTIAVLTSLLLISLVSATQVQIKGETNGSSIFETTFINDEIINSQYIEINGKGYWQVFYDDGSSELLEVKEYIKSNEDKWSQDEKGTSLGSVVNLIKNAVSWLKGENEHATDEAIATGEYLDEYFASDEDTYYLYMEIQNLKLRVESLENTIEETSSEAYCQGKLEVLEKYKLGSVTCGDTVYVNHKKSPITGNDIIYGIKGVDPKSLGVGNLDQVSFKGSESNPEFLIEGILIPKEIKADEPFEIVVRVRNVGETEGESQISLKLPSDWVSKEDYVTVNVKKDEFKDVVFSVTPDNNPGLVNVNLEYEKNGEKVELSSQKHWLYPKISLLDKIWKK